MLWTTLAPEGKESHKILGQAYFYIHDLADGGVCMFCVAALQSTSNLKIGTRLLRGSNF
jgi:hypothetical protein